ncbi:hypothetical protein K439DRAFT_1620957 [Ramaria rubella]|nr:hypothetical protein K439DRAFT_1620957 [Ramaria rubella]
MPIRKKAAEWTLEDNVTLINLLIDHKAEAGEGRNFKKATWVAVAAGMAGHPYKGGLKTLELRKDYNVALKLKHNLSGFTFLDTQGVVIDNESVWADFTAKNKNVARVGRTRFPCFELMSTLISSVARGTHVYQASSQPTALEILVKERHAGDVHGMDVDNDGHSEVASEGPRHATGPSSASGPPSSASGSPSSASGPPSSTY